MTSEPILRIENLHKQFDLVTALDGVSLEVHPGRIVGLLGANGSGKSTLIRHIVGLYLPDRGTCTTLGREAGQLTPRELARIGYVHQEGQLVDWMRVAQLVRYVSAYYPTWNHDIEREYFNRFELDPDAVVGNLSPGQRQMLAILLAIGFEPDLLILDEPAAALDPIARQRFLDLVLEVIQNPGRTVLISSHILSDVEKIIDHVVILEKGAIRRDTPFDDLREEFVKLRMTALRGSLPEELPFADPLSCRRNGTEAVLILPAQPREALERKASEVDATVVIRPLTLEEIYGLVLSSDREGVRS